MNWTIAFPKVYFPEKLDYQSKILLIGSCFTEHIGNFLKDLKFQVLQNPASILFDPQSISFHLKNWADEDQENELELFYFQELWHSWLHHSDFSRPNSADVKEAIEQSNRTARQFLKNADWLIVTLGSSYSYRLTEKAVSCLNNYQVGLPVANCHRCPAAWFTKYLMTDEETFLALSNAFNAIRNLNPKVQFLLNISPVRHLRDGVVENNRSKARLIEATHRLVESRSDTFYLPSYEIVIDVLRDYRFYDLDKAHPNYEATKWVLEFFLENYFTSDCKKMIVKVQDVVSAFHHKPRNPNTSTHQKFLENYLAKVLLLEEEIPYLDWEREKNYFRNVPH